MEAVNCSLKESLNHISLENSKPDAENCYKRVYSFPCLRFMIKSVFIGSEKVQLITDERLSC